MKEIYVLYRKGYLYYTAWKESLGMGFKKGKTRRTIW
jgi:hypothetical protein